MVARTELSQRRRTPHNFAGSLRKSYIGIGGVAVASNASLNFGTGDFTVAGWFNWDSIPTTGVVFGKTADNFTNGIQGWHISRAGTPNDCLFEIQDGAARDNMSFKIAGITGWFFLAAKRVGTTSSVYVNGVLANTETSAIHGGNVDNSANLTIFTDDAANTVTGGLATEFRAWNVELTNEEIATLYFDGVVPQTASLQIELLMTDGTGTTVTDSSGNGNNGTFTGTNPLWDTQIPYKARTELSVARTDISVARTDI